MGELPPGGELPKLQVVPLGWEVPPRWQLHPGGELQHLPLDPRHHVPDGGLGQRGGEAGYLRGLQGHRRRSGEGGQQPGSHRWRHGWDDEGGVLRLRNPRKPSGETLCGKKGAGLSSGALGSPAGPQPREEREPAAGPAMVAGEWGGCLGNPGNGGSVPTADQPLADILGRTAGFAPKQAAQRKTWPSPAGLPSHAALAMPTTLPHRLFPVLSISHPRTSFHPHGPFPSWQVHTITDRFPYKRFPINTKRFFSQRDLVPKNSPLLEDFSKHFLPQGMVPTPFKTSHPKAFASQGFPS